ncbi:hypothetical protein [Mycoplasma buteonis]|uniref:hypothetical protein n=1 Tax=Mycoplasma buteonis TaxID=171280 RepID=UPI00055DCBA1|nr:hypothetical protein [Mycoplasma buteonis]
MKKNQKNILNKTMGYATFIAGATTLGAFGWLVALNHKVTAKVEDNYVFEQLKNQKNEVEDFLAKNSDLEEQYKEQLNNLVVYSNQLLANKDSSVYEMLQQRNILKEELLKTKVLISSPNDLNLNVNNYLGLIKESDLQKEVKKLKKGLSVNSKSDKEALFNKLAPLLELQNKLTIDLESQIWNLHEDIVKGKSSFNNIAQKSKVLDVVANALNILNQDSYSHDTLEVIKNNLDREINQISKAQAELNSAKISFNTLALNVKSEIQALEGEQDKKNYALQLADQYVKQAQSSNLKYSYDKKTELKHLNDLLQNLINNFEDLQTQTTESLKDKIEEKIQTLKSKFITNTFAIHFLDEIKVDETPKNELNKLLFTLNDLPTYLESFNETEKQINKRINDLTNERLITSDFATQIKRKVNQIHEGINTPKEYLTYAVKVLNELEDNALITKMYKESFKELLEQTDDSIQNGYKVDKPLLTDNARKIESQINTAIELKDLYNNFQHLANSLRDINKEELKNYVDFANENLENNSKLTESTRNLLTDLNEKAAFLTPENSTATRTQLQNLIKQYRIASENVEVDGTMAETNKVKHASDDKVKQAFNYDANPNDKFANELLDDLHNLQKEAQLIALDEILTPEEKAEKLAEINAKMEAISDKAPDFKELEETLKESQLALDSTKGDKQEEAALENEIQKIKDLQAKVHQAINDPLNANPSELNEELKQAIQDFKEKQAHYQANSDYDRAIQKVNNTFAPDMEKGKNTPTQQKLIDKLNELKEIVGNTALDEATREEARNKIRAITEIVEISRELEIANKNLALSVEIAKKQELGEFLPNAEISKADTLNQEVNTYLDTINSKHINTGEEYQAYLAKVKEESENLKYAISIAALKKAGHEIGLEKYTGNNTEKEPYVTSNQNVDKLTKAVNDIIKKFETEGKTAVNLEEIDDLETEVKKQIYLAMQIKEALIKLDTIDENENPQAYNNLKIVIADSQITVGDDRSNIDLKIKDIRREMNKTEGRIAANQRLKELKLLYSDEDLKRAILDDEVVDFNKNVEKFADLIADRYTSFLELSSLDRKIDSYRAEKEKTKNRILREYKSAVDSIENLRTQFQLQKEDQNVNVTKYSDEVFATFDDIKNKFDDATQKYPTKTSDILDLKPLISLAWYKDLYFKKSVESVAKLNEIPNVNAAELFKDQATVDQINSKLKANNKKLIDAYDSKIMSITNPTQISDVKDFTNRLTALDTLLSQEKEVVDYLNKQQKTEQNKIFAQNLENALLKASFDSLDNEGYQAVVSAEIREKRQELFKTYIENITLQEAKDNEKSKIDAYKTKIDAKLTEMQSDDPQLQTEIDTFISALLQNIADVQDKSEILAIDQKLSDLMDKENALVDLAQAVKKVEDLVTVEKAKTDAPESNKVILDLLAEKAKNAKDNYLKLDEANLIKKESELNKLVEQYQLLIETQNLHDEVKKQVDALEYPLGNTPNGNVEAKKKFVAFMDFLQQQLTENMTERTKVMSIQSLLKKTKDLIEHQNAKIALQKTVNDDHSFVDVVYKPEQKATYGFDKDAKILADLIIASVPSNDVNVDSMQNSLINALEFNFANAFSFYQARKKELLGINNDDESVADKGIKFVQKDKLTGGQTDVLPKYSKLWADNNDYYNEVSLFIKEAENEEKIGEKLNEVSLFSKLFAKYKEIADLIALGQEKLDSVSEELKTNEYITNSIEKLTNEIATDKDYYYKEKNVIKLDKAISDLNAYVNRFNLAFKIAEAAKKLADFKTQSGDEDYLTEEDKKPLKAILDFPFADLKQNPNKEGNTQYLYYIDTFLEGGSSQSFKVAMEKSINLRKKVHLAEKYLNKYKEKSASNSSYETSEMQALYTKLEAKVTEANNALHNLAHDENLKNQLISQIENGSDGIIDQILKTKSDEVLKVYIRDVLLDKFMQSNYPNNDLSPRLADYKTVAIQPLQTQIQNENDIAAIHDKINAADEKYKEQYAKIWTWEKNRYLSFKNKFKPYYELLTKDANGLSKEFLQKNAGISADLLAKYVEVTKQTAEKNYPEDYINAEQTDKTDFDEKFKQNAKTIIESLNKAATTLKDLYAKIINVSAPKLIADKNQLIRMKNQFTDNESENITAALKTIKQFDALNSKITAFNNASSQLESLDAANIQHDDSEANLKFETATEDNTDVTSKRTAYFEKYKNYLNNISNSKQKLNELIYGTSDQDKVSLVDVLKKYIDGADGYIGRANYDEFIKLVAKQETSNLANFEKAKFEYEKTSLPATALATEVSQLNKETSSTIDEYLALTKGYDRASGLGKWFTYPSNSNTFFDYLNKAQGDKFVYSNIKPLDTTSAEQFQDLLNGNQINETEINFDGTNYKAKLINDKTNVLDLFNEFNILKGTNANIFNLDNVKVYAIKSANEPSSQYVKTQLQSDATIKKGFVSLLIRYEKPTSVAANNSAFSDLENFAIKFDSVAITFKTFDDLLLTKDMFKHENLWNPAPNADNSRVKPFFKDAWAGWNSITAPINFMSAFIKYSSGYLQSQAVNYFTENINEEAKSDASSTSTSTKNFRIKLKFKEAGYKGYKQVGDKIYWKTLIPNLASQSGIDYQSSDKYINTQIFTEPAKTDYKTNYGYIYANNSDPKRVNDTNKMLLFLPVVIVIPVQDDSGNYAAMVINWKWLNRFATNSSDNAPQNIVISNEEMLRNLYIFKPKEEGKTNQSTNDADKFAKYVASKIKYREFVKDTFSDTTSTLKLWGADRYVQLDTTDQGKHYRDGIGHDEFINALEKLDIFMKLH